MVRYRLSVSFVSALLVVVAVAAAVVLTGLVSAASRTLGWALACSVVALLLAPVVGFFERRLPRPIAIVVSLLLVVIVLGGTWVGLAATLADNVETLKTEAPAAAADLEDRSEVAADFGLARRTNDLVDSLDDSFGAGAEVRRAAGTAPTYVVTGTLMLFLLIYGGRFVSGGLAQIRDEGRRERMRAVLHRAGTRGRGYLLLALAEIIVVTLICWLAFFLLGLTAPFGLGLSVGLLSVVPSMGILLGGIPALVLAAAFEGTEVALPVLAVVIALQVVDALIVKPSVERHTLHVGPALIAIVGLLGWTLYGFGGAVYGVAALVLLLSLASAAATDDEGVDVVTGEALGDVPPASTDTGPQADRT